MSKTHNKRRNAGLLYEFLVRCISSALVEGEKRKSGIALKLLKKHFKPGTELYREFRLINALVRSTVSSEAIATSILNEAKSAARSYNLETLEKEKSILIKNINYHLRDSDFYDQHIPDYKAWATAQVLVNNWRTEGRDRDIGALASYEDQMSKWLVSEKTEKNDSSLLEESPGTTRLLMKIMTKKLNEKYSLSLEPDQKSVLKTYIFSTSQNNDSEAISRKLLEVKQDLLQSIDEFCQVNASSKYLIEKMSGVKNELMSESLEKIDDDTITRFMMYMKLNNEIKSEE